MQILLERGPLLDALKRVGGVVENRNIVPILGNVLLRTEEEGLRLIATNLDIETSARIDASVMAGGEITVPARQFTDIVSRTEPGAQISLSFDPATDPRVKVKAGRSNYSLPALPATDFPSMEGVKNGVSYQLLPSDLARLIAKTQHAAATEEARYIMNGAYLHTISEEGSDYLRLTTTNQFRLASVDMPAPQGAIAAPPVVIHRRAIGIISQMIDGITQPCEISVSEAKFALRAGDAAMISKVLDGEFPSYQRIIPRGDGQGVARLSGGALAKALDRAGIMAEDKVRSIHCEFADGLLTISSRNESGGQAEVQIDIDHEGDSGSFNFNARYLHDIASLVGDSRMACHLFGDNAPIRINDDADPGATFVVSAQR